MPSIWYLYVGLGLMASGALGHMCALLVTLRPKDKLPLWLKVVGGPAVWVALIIIRLKNLEC